jgi:hypothetical protein
MMLHGRRATSYGRCMDVWTRDADAARMPLTLAMPRGRCTIEAGTSVTPTFHGRWPTTR